MKHEKHSVFTDALADVYTKEMLDEINTMNVIPHKFSPEFEKKTQKLIKKRKKPYYNLIRTSGRRAACICAAVLIAFGGTLSVEAVRGKMADFVNKIFLGYDKADIPSVSSEQCPETIEREYSINVPDGFALDEEWLYKSDNYTDTRYVKGDKYIIFRQHVLNDDFDAYVDGETLKKECFTDENNNSYTVYVKEDTVTVVFRESFGYLFEVISNLDKNEIINICINIS